LISRPGDFGTAWLMESQRRFQEVSVHEALRQWGRFRVDRYRHLDRDKALATLEEGRKRIGDRYPAWKLGLMLADRMRRKVIPWAPAKWSWLGELDPRVKCSGWVGVGYLPQGERFGRLTTNDLDPDDIVDWIDAHPEDWESVVSLTPDLS
jgi:hypothetical protein